jgi:hypothetical protein
MIVANSVYWNYLTSKIRRYKHVAPSRLRDREAHVVAVISLCSAIPRHRLRLQSKVCILTRLITLVATITLAAAILFRFPADFRMMVCIIISVAATALAARSLFTGKLILALLFLGVVGAFTPFHRNQFSLLLTYILDMATLALFAASPIILGKSAAPLAHKRTSQSVVNPRY